MPSMIRLGSTWLGDDPRGQAPGRERLDRACRLLYGRPARETDQKAAERFLSGGGDWPAWLRVMFSSNEFVYLD